MKILNIVLSVLILLLAIVSAVFSYMLFDKRSQMVDSYTELSAGIRQASSALDANSGTAVAKSLDDKSLSYQSSNLKSAISRLSDQARKVAKQRDALAQEIASIDAEVQNLPEGIEVAKLTSLGEYSDAIESVDAQVKSMIANRNQIVKGISGIASNFDISVSENQLKSADPNVCARALTGFVTELNDVKKYKDMQEATMKKIASDLGVKGLTFSPVRYRDDLAKYTDAINGLRSDKANLEKGNADLTANLKAAEKKVADLEAANTELKAEVARRLNDYDRLQASLEGRVYQHPVVLWQPGSKEAREAVDGKIIDVNTKFGYVVIDVGGNYLVNQPIGEEFSPAPVNPEIAADDDMLVYRNTQYVGRIKVFKVEDNCAFASIIDGSESNMKIGDNVVFRDNQ